MDKKTLTIAGAAVAALSAVALTDYVVKKRREESAALGLLLAGVGGMLLGAALAAEPRIKAYRALSSTDLVREEDALHMGSIWDFSPEEHPTVELDEETSEENYI